MRDTSPRRLLFGISLLLFLSAIQPVFAQELNLENYQPEPWVKEVPCKPGEQLTDFIGDREFRLCVTFSGDKLQPSHDGTPNVSYIYITSYARKGRGNLTALDVARTHPEGYPGLILGAAVTDGPEQPGNLSCARRFKVRVEVTNQVKSAKYPIGVLMTAGTESTKDRVEFNLPILVPSSASVGVKLKDKSLVDCWAGSKCSPLKLELQNKLPYKVSIEKISVTSEDLEDEPIGNYRIEIQNSLRDLNLELMAKPLGLARVFRGFGPPELEFRIDYKDEFGRSFSSDWQKSNFEIRPNLPMIGLFLIVGAGVGTFLRLDPGKLQRRNLTTARKRRGFIATTFATGIFVCILALLIDIKIVLLSDKSSLSPWDPKMLLLTALLATLGGLPLIYAYFKIPQPTEAPPQNPQTPQGPGPQGQGN